MASWFSPCQWRNNAEACYPNRCQTWISSQASVCLGCTRSCKQGLKKKKKLCFCPSLVELPEKSHVLSCVPFSGDAEFNEAAGYPMVQQWRVRSNLYKVKLSSITLASGQPKKRLPPLKSICSITITRHSFNSGYRLLFTLLTVNNLICC